MPLANKKRFCARDIAACCHVLWRPGTNPCPLCSSAGCAAARALHETRSERRFAPQAGGATDEFPAQFAVGTPVAALFKGEDGTPVWTAGVVVRHQKPSGRARKVRYRVSYPGGTEETWSEAALREGSAAHALHFGKAKSAPEAVRICAAIVLLGTRVASKFRNTSLPGKSTSSWYPGVVAGVGKDPTETRWRVLYDDGDVDHNMDNTTVKNAQSNYVKHVMGLDLGLDMLAGPSDAKKA